MSVLAEFFHGADTTLGVFYPVHFLVAVFSNFEAAQATAQKLRLAGSEPGDVIAVHGKDVIELDKEEKTVGGLLMQSLSRFFATEQKFTDQDLQLARHDAGFLAVRCPDDKAKSEAWSVIENEHPLDARYYAPDGIEHLAGDFKTD